MHATEPQREYPPMETKGIAADKLPSTMSHAVLNQPGELVVEECSLPEPGVGEVLVKVEMAAICGSDSSIYRGKLAVTLPLVPGHEAVGRVAAIGQGVESVAGGQRVEFGQRVVIVPNYGCGSCPVCLQGLWNVCPAKVRIGVDTAGVFAGYAVIPAHCLVPVPDSLDNRTAVFTEPAAVAYHGFRKAEPKPGQRVLVIGAGVIGLLIIQLAKNSGAEVTALDLVQQRLAKAVELGAAAGCNTVDAAAESGLYDVVFDTSGAPVALDIAVKLAAPGARLVILGLAGVPHEVTSSVIVRKELTIMGSMIYNDEFPAVLKMLEEGVIRTEKMISSVHGLSGLAGDLERFNDPDRVKALIDLEMI